MNGRWRARPRKRLGVCSDLTPSIEELQAELSRRLAERNSTRWRECAVRGRSIAKRGEGAGEAGIAGDGRASVSSRCSALVSVPHFHGHSASVGEDEIRHAILVEIVNEQQLP